MTRRVALLGNPNVGKSTIFNALTGMRQHTGNWAGVTVSCTWGTFSIGDMEFSVVDLPGIYSYDTRSAEEDVTKSFVESLEYDVLVVVCDATCLERGLHLLKQTMDIICPTYQTPQTCLSGNSTEQAPSRHSPLPALIFSVNLCDEAAKKGIIIDFPLLERKLGIPVIPCCARDVGGLDRLKSMLSTLEPGSDGGYPLLYGNCPPLPDSTASDILTDTLADTFTEAQTTPQTDSPSAPGFHMRISPAQLAAQTVRYTNINYRKREETLDRIFTGRFTGTLCMLLLLTGVFWLTITGANYPSSLLWDLFFRFETILTDLTTSAGLPDWFIGMSVSGVYRVVAWIVSVMLPPMAIFFPLFTLMEDFGLLPRIAYNMDGAFHACGACGKQCLTMAMGLGCNAAGVTGCRIIDSPRERLIAILTNSLVPCNGRFPLLITMISLGIIGVSGGTDRTVSISLLPALALTGFLLLGVAMTLAASYFLSHTLLKGIPSSFTLELPPYRRPQIGRVLVRSIFDRTLFVLGRAVLVAAPAGLLIWILGNLAVIPGEGLVLLDGITASLTTGEPAPVTLLAFLSDLLDPFGRLMGLDGVILLAFILGFPANEIVLPIILMAYMQNGVLVEIEDTGALFALLSAHDWTLKTFVCMAVFSLFHWPCSTTCLTIKKETGSWKWTAVACLLPTILGCALCMLISGIYT